MIVYQKLKIFIDKLLNLAPGGFYGILSMSIGLCFTLIAYFQVSGFNMFETYISYLGVIPGFVGFLFNIGMILNGLIAFPFFINLGWVLQTEDFSGKMGSYTIKLSIIGCISLIFIGLLPAYYIIIGIFHAFFAVVYFCCALISCILYGILMWFDTRFSKVHTIICFTVSGIITFFLFTGWAIFEWLMMFAGDFWVIEISIYMLIKKI
jgi:hypothetical membrane protein